MYGFGGSGFIALVEAYENVIDEIKEYVKAEKERCENIASKFPEEYNRGYAAAYAEMEKKLKEIVEDDEIVDVR